MKATYNSLWSEAEMRAAVEAYVRMLRLQQDNRDFVKSDIIREVLDGTLAGRTRASVEWRFQNISAVMEQAGRPRVAGYAPARHVGEPSRRLIRRLLQEFGEDL